MDSSLMNSTESLTTLGVESDALLRLCLDPNTPRDEIGKALNDVRMCQEDLKHRSEYWLLLALATELHRPHSAPRYVPRLFTHAYACDDVSEFELQYARQRVIALQRRTERSSASISSALWSAYHRRFLQAQNDLQEISDNR